MTSQPSLLRLTARLVRLHPRATLATLVGLTFAGALALSCPRTRVDLATFNIRDFPEADAQVEGAFETIAALDVPLIAVEEITDPARFIAAAHQHLGPSWRAEFGRTRNPQRPDRRRVGVLYDSAHYRATATHLHPLPGTNSTGRPALEVRLEPTRAGPNLRVFVVHLKSGSDSVETRARQIHALTSVVRKAVAGPDEVVVLGDFNSTGETDRANLATFANETGLNWATEDLGCTAYWKPQGKCSSSSLDHVFTSKPSRAAARGPCETEGCEPGDSCPVFFDVVSDHCPVTASF